MHWKRFQVDSNGKNGICRIFSPQYELGSGKSKTFGSNPGLPLIGLYNLEYDTLDETFLIRKMRKMLSTLYVGLKTETDNVYGVISIITYSHINSPYPLITRFLS